MISKCSWQYSWPEKLEKVQCKRSITKGDVLIKLLLAIFQSAGEAEEAARQADERRSRDGSAVI